MAANHLSTAISELPAYILFVVGKDKLEGGSVKATIYKYDNSIKIGYIQGWNSLSKSNQEKLKAATVQK